MSKRPLDKLSHALRRQAQVSSLRRPSKDGDVSLSESTATKAAGGGDGSVAPACGASPGNTVGSDTSHPATATTTHPSAGVKGAEDRIIHANYSLRHALARGAPETPLTRQVKHAIQQSTGKAEALKAFQVLLQADGDAPTAATFKTLSATLLQHHVEDRVGHAAFEKALTDAVGHEGDRWRRLSEEERSTFVNYTCRTTERWAERGSAYNKLLGFSQEGTDNEVVAKLEYQMRKCGAPVSASSLADLMHLDVTWSTALHLYNFAGELQKYAPPPMEMTDRLMGLMTGYKSGIGGSRPWIRALALYQQALVSGYDTTLTTHTHALDALWRSADTFHRVHSPLSSSHQQWVWENALAITQRVQETPRLLLTGDEGCAYAESVVKAFAASGRWSVAVSFLGNMDTSNMDLSFRFLVPTAETYAFAMAACHTAGHAAHGEALWTIFRETYTLRSLHSEVLSILLQSLRHVVRTSPIVGQLVEELVTDGKGLERQATVAVLQLLSSRYVKTTEQRWVLAAKLLDMYDANPWPQQPQARKTELQTVFRCCHLISVMEEPDGKRLLLQLRQHLVDVFGGSSAEVEWLDDTAIYALQVTSNWREAIAIYDAAVDRRKPEQVPYLPIPLRQAKIMLVEALVRSCMAMKEVDEFFLVDEDTQEADRDAAVTLTQRALAVTRAVFRPDDTFPHHLYAELLLMQALSATTSAQRKSHAVEAMRHFSQASAELIEHRLVARVATALSLTEVHVENALLVGHATLRHATLSQRSDRRRRNNVHGGFDVVAW
ncbi:hypothetical protein TraAM80_00346 [Trypanosoma rangeli]|uniref:Uncharacterized protein n=1 Tax=Trypanosoma rangeli TaxID=5698 RepID=A0A3S5ISN2_TRYRA|nr:uncharacterized protein TraAM80_00346 [Trypanosoma rangeli]RNF12335.1 hypothetical protein TraAM80_00346 [Trypanosoma rangeli]|eukprot:RNF12335.1 hypothetical protein TraAM80_00346 [Trypanosoma rangeli]